MSRSRIPGGIKNQFAPPAEKRAQQSTGWSRFYLNSATRVDPSGGANLTINSEAPGAYTDVTRNALNAKKPCTEVSAFFYTLRHPDTNDILTWRDEWQVTIHIVMNQYSDTGTSSGRGQSLCALMTNSIICDGSDHHYFGCGTYNLDEDDIKIIRTYSGDCSGAPNMQTRIIKNSGFTQQSRHVISLENSRAMGVKGNWIEYRNFDNSVESGGRDDIDGYDYSTTTFVCAATDIAYLCLYLPGINSTSSMHLTNMQFKAYFQVTIRDPDPLVIGE